MCLSILYIFLCIFHYACCKFFTVLKFCTFLYLLKNFLGTHCAKSVQIRSFFWSVFSRLRTECRKIRTRKNSVFGYFQRSDMICVICENDFQWSGDVRVSCCNKIINFKFCLRVIYEHLVTILLMEKWQTLHNIFLQIFLFLYW